MKKALVTGGAGFVGRHMIAHLEAAGWEVDRSDILWGNGGAPNYGNQNTLYDLVIHAAARSPHRKAIDQQHSIFPYNVMLDSSILHWAATTKQKHLIYLSSSAAYPVRWQEPGNRTPLREHMASIIETPADTYGWTKLIGEKLVQNARLDGLPVTVVRPFSGYAEDQSPDFPFRAFIERVKRREAPFKIWGSAHQVRDWIHIDDICTAILVLVNEKVDDVVNLCTGRGTTMLDLARMMHDEVGFHPAIEVDELAPLGVHYRVGDPTRLHEFYVPKISIEEGVRRAFELR